MPWQRTGECNRCGDCCKGNPFDNSDNNDVYCPLLQLVAGVFTCTDRQHPYYLQGCNVFPQHPSQIADKPNCSYSFEWVEDGTT